MYFRKLEELKGYYPETLLKKFDKYLQEMPRAYEDRIQSHIIANNLKISFNAAHMLIEQSCKIGVLTERYILKCPECGLVLKLVDADELSEAIEKANYCYGCDFGSDNLDLKIGTENIESIYRLNR